MFKLSTDYHISFRMLEEDEVEFTVKLLPEEVQVRGNALASGIESEDKECEDAILARLERDEIEAWCHLCVSARYNNFVGCCSFGSTDEQYYLDTIEEMKREALSDLNTKIEFFLNQLKQRKDNEWQSKGQWSWTSNEEIERMIEENSEATKSAREIVSNALTAADGCRLTAVFNLAEALYWYCDQYHQGQWSTLYSVLSRLGKVYRPSPLSNGLSDEAAEINSALEAAHCDAVAEKLLEYILGEKE